LHSQNESAEDMNRKLLFLPFLILSTLIVLSANGKTRWRGQKQYIYRYYLNDKQGCDYTIERPSHFLSQKAIERRKRQRLKIDQTDLPVSRQYLRQMQLPGVQIIGTSKWNNTVIVRSADTLQLHHLAQLPFIRESRMVWQSPDSIDTEPDAKWNVREQFQKWDSVTNDPYGMSRPQIEMLGGERLHEIGLRGEEMTIAVLDGGFQSANRIPCLRGTKIIGTRDFVQNGEHMTGRHEIDYTGIDHGTKVLSVLAADAPEVMLGTAPVANYWLLRCEDPATEQPVEEDYWAMAAEYADSVGADIISSSLGYNEYDNGHGTYQLKDLDGHTALISRTASMLAHKGIVLCNSAGNSGMNAWKKIGVPADARDILTVGAVGPDGKIAVFSSVGPSQDLRVKPDVVAMGAPTTLINGKGMLCHDMGTSFSTPLIAGLVACLWQGLRQMTALEIIELVRQSASQYDTPDNIYGYGTPDFWNAYMAGQPQ
jgi:subtilisin family serine protease